MDGLGKTRRFVGIGSSVGLSAVVKPMGRVNVLILILVGLLGWATVSQGQQVNYDGQIVRQVRIEGNSLVPAGDILANIRTHSGAAFNSEMVEDDARRVVLMPEVYNVEWSVIPVEGQVDLVFTVTESPRISELIIVGNNSFDEETLLRELNFQSGDFLDLYLVNSGVENLLRFYHSKGYYSAEVTLNERALATENRVVYLIVEGAQLRINSVTFEGNTLPAWRLATKISTTAYFPILFKGLLDDEQLRRDVETLAGYYHDEGFLDARVFARKDINEQQTRAAVTFVIEEGMRYHISDISFSGNERFSDEELIEQLTDFEIGDILTSGRRTTAQRVVARTYGAEGYIYTRVNILRQFTEEPGEVQVVFDIDEGSIFDLGRVIVRGNTETRDRVVRREFDRHGFLPGGLYNTDAMERGRRRLLGNGLFSDVNVTPIGNEPQQRDALVEVEETQTGMIMMGVGMDTNSGLVGQFSLQQQNFDLSRWPTSLEDLFSGRAFVGGGQRLRLDLEPGTEVTRGRLNFYEPYLFDQPYYLDLSLYLTRRGRECYMERRIGSAVTLGHRFDNNWSVDVGFRAEVIDISDLDIGYSIPNDPTSPLIVISPQDVIDVEGSNILSSVSFGVGHDTTDSMFRPSEGHIFRAGWEQVGVPGGDFTFADLSSSFHAFHTIYTDIVERRTVLSGHIEGRTILGNAPVFERYYAGGIGNLRGFDYRGVSPRDGIDDDPIGSDYMLTMGTELSHPLFEETFYGKLFIDTAIISEGPYRVTAGFGLELLVPQLFQTIPMHFDFGFPIYSDDKDDEQVFSFSFGLNF
ncbi:MAG: outer membrane protein assembly factor BamA [Sedimentisphaerales bacterium]|nr:outer membrane protein assembly factor BamA [Sedimentisphaerales bacterium]